MIANELHQFIINIVMSRAHGQVKVFWRHGQRKNISPFSVAWVSHKTRNVGSLIKFWQEWRIHLAYLKQLLQVLKEKASTIHLQVSWLHVKQIYFMAKLAIPSSSYQTYAHTETEYIFHIFSRLANHTKVRLRVYCWQIYWAIDSNVSGKLPSLAKRVEVPWHRGWFGPCFYAHLNCRGSYQYAIITHVHKN